MKSMKKAALTFLLLCCIIFSACGKASSHAASFSLDVINPTTKFNVRDICIYTAELKNRTGNEYTSKHGASTLRMYLYPKEGKSSPLGYASSYSFSTIEPYETITGTLRVFATQAGDYILEVWCELAIDGEIIRVDMENISITIEPEDPQQGW